MCNEAPPLRAMNMLKGEAKPLICMASRLQVGNMTRCRWFSDIHTSGFALGVYITKPPLPQSYYLNLPAVR